MGRLAREATLIFASHLISDQLLKEFAPLGVIFFPVRIDPFLKGLHCPGKLTGSCSHL